MNGAQSLFKALLDAGITTCFANPGTSEMQLVYEIGMTDKVRPVLCLQEDVVTGAADGYGRMTGAPAFTLLHVGSGFANGIAMLHNAGRANTPIVNVVGANATYHQPNYPEHELINGRVTDLARTVSHWSQEARSASHLGELGAEAAALARTGKICTIVAPTNCHWEEASPPPTVPAPLGRPKAAAEAIAHGAAMLTNGKKTGLVLGNLALQGEVDIYSAPQFKEVMIQSIDEGAKHIVVDLAGVTFIDSTALGVLVSGAKRVRPQNGTLDIVCHDENITRIFEITGLDRIFGIYPTREKALESATV